MEKNIKKIEDMSLNAWPSHKMELYDGWILRFSYFYTHRTNSVEQFGTSTLPWREKVSYCEDVYKRLGSPAVFKISPLVSPDFDYTLENRGYEIQHTTEVMTVHLTDPAPESAYSEVTLTDKIPDIWITSLFDLKGMTNPIHRAVVPSMYRAIPKETICASIWKEGKIIATGLGILDRDYIGIYAIHVKEKYRSRGYARQICTGLLSEGHAKRCPECLSPGSTGKYRCQTSLYLSGISGYPTLTGSGFSLILKNSNTITTTKEYYEIFTCFLYLYRNYSYFFRMHAQNYRPASCF